MEKNNETVIPRYEFRAFAPNFGRVVDEIRRRSACELIRESLESYLLTAVNDTYNLKLRYNQLDIKELINVTQGLEQWRPILKLDFPVTAQPLLADIFPALGAPAPPLPAGEIAAEQFLEAIIRPLPEVGVARVFKRRFHFIIEACMVEIGELLVNGAAVQSVAVEGESATAVLRVKDLIGLGAYENVSYPLALKRIMGLAPLPPQTWQM